MQEDEQRVHSTNQHLHIPTLNNNLRRITHYSPRCPPTYLGTHLSPAIPTHHHHHHLPTYQPPKSENFPIAHDTRTKPTQSLDPCALPRSRRPA
jgi:hypothetical protein